MAGKRSSPNADEDARPQDDPGYQDAGQAYVEEANADQPAPVEEPAE